MAHIEYDLDTLLAMANFGNGGAKNYMIKKSIFG
jgi:hypothetical protein